MTATQVLDELRAGCVTLKVVGDKLRYEGPKQTLTPERISQLGKHQVELIHILQSEENAGEDDYKEIVKEARQRGWFVLDEQNAYSRQLTPTRTVFLLRDSDGTWCVWRGDWSPGKAKPYA